MVCLVFIGLGASLNTQSRFSHQADTAHQSQSVAGKRLNQALELLSQTQATTVLAQSGFYRTRAWGQLRAGAYLNAVACLQTTLLPLQLLNKLLLIERQLGRRRQRKRWGPRAIDLDMLLYAQTTIKHARLQAPHPWMWQREFVMYPLSELADWLSSPQRLHLQRALFEYNGCVLTRPKPLKIASIQD